MTEGKHTSLCPFIAGGMSWNMGSLQPEDRLMYKVGNEWCMDLTIQKTTPVLEPMAQLNIGADFNITQSARRQGARPRVGARPHHRRKKMGGRLPEPPLASLLSTGGNLRVRARCARLAAHAYDAQHRRRAVEAQQRPGSQRRHHHLLGQGKRYVAVMTGWGRLAGDDYATFFGGTFGTNAKGLGHHQGVCPALNAGDLNTQALSRAPVFRRPCGIDSHFPRVAIVAVAASAICALCAAAAVRAQTSTKPGPMQSGAHASQLQGGQRSSSQARPSGERRRVQTPSELFATVCGWCHEQRRA